MSQTKRTPAAEYHPSIRKVVLIEFALSLTYATFIDIFYRLPGTVPGHIAHRWVEAVGPIVDVVFLIAPRSAIPSGAEWSDRIAIYRHILLICMLLAVWSFIQSEAHLNYWSSQIRRSTKVALSPAENLRREAFTGFYLMIFGIIAILVLAFFGEYQLGGVATYLFTQDWTYIRAPILTAVANAFACYAIAFKRSASGAG